MNVSRETFIKVISPNVSRETLGFVSKVFRKEQ